MGNLYGGIAVCPDPEYVLMGDGAQGVNLDEELYKEAMLDIAEVREFSEDEADVLQMQLDNARSDDDVCEVIDRAYHTIQQLDGVI